MEFRESFSLTESDPADFGMQTVRFVCYRGSLSKPEWVDQDECKFLGFLPRVFVLTHNCSVFLSILCYPRRPKRGHKRSGSDEGRFRPGLLPTRL